MENYNVYQQIAERTQGDIYVGVVGPVRTGKSTFIKRFMDLLVLPNIGNQYQKDRARDELPQSSAGRTIMTTEPKFVPNEAVEITVDSNVRLKVRMVDCVGYLVKGALGYFENNQPRMVSTPWFDHQIPFEEAAEIGTKKVINEHSTVGVLITTDGSITDISREDYIIAEERIVEELKRINKPFIIVLNTTTPYDAESLKLRDELEQKYAVSVVCVNCQQMRIDDINTIIEKVLSEFPVSEININIPKWITALSRDHWLVSGTIDAIRGSLLGIERIREIKNHIPNFYNYDYISKAYIENINPGDGSAFVEINMQDGLFYRILSEETGLNIEGEYKLISIIKDLARVKIEYEKIENALIEVRNKGYGMVTPMLDELTLEEPEMVKQGSKFGVRLRASAPSIHMIRADIETEIAPLVGTEKQSKELVSYLQKEFEGDPSKLWESNIFGKSLHELVSEGLNNKLCRMPEDAQQKLQETLQRIINEGSNGLICIIL